MTTGALWHGPLPSGWDSAPLKAMARARSGATPDSSNEAFWCEPDDGLPWVAIADMSGRDAVHETAKGLTREGQVEKGLSAGRPGTLLFAMYASVGEVARLAIPAAWNQAILGLTPYADRSVSRYLHYALMAIRPHLALDFRSNTQNNLNAWQVAHLRIPCPPVSDQQAVADFLDRETAQIDAMIEAQEQVVARLTERRSSTITALVTGHALGLPLTASGNPLLGEVPEGWEVGRFGRHTRINGGQVDPGIEPWNEMILVAPNHVESGTGRFLALETAAEQGADSGKYLVRKGQIIYSKIRPSLNKVTIAPQDVLCSADMYGITCLGQGDHRYFANFMRATPFHQYATMVSDRVKMPKINREELSAAPWLVPPTAEQTRIADLVDATTRELDTAISETRALSALLHERREALITAAVTGRIDPTTGIERIDPTTEREAS